MCHQLKIFFFLLFGVSLSGYGAASPDNIALAVWANEAIVSTYTYDYQNLIARQKEIATYFTSEGWISYSKAILDSKLLDAVKQNNYVVSAVATMPPVVKSVGAQQWQATMPVLVVYKNPQYKQKQTLNVTLTFITAPAGQGVRGLAITRLQAVLAKPACRCAKESQAHVAIV